MTSKKKLLITVGAGASLDFGMPSCNDIDKLFTQWAQEEFTLEMKPNQNLYTYIRDEIKDHYAKGKENFKETVNFEDVLFQVSQLASYFGNKNYYANGICAFLEHKNFPTIKYNNTPQPVNADILTNLYKHLIDKLVEEFIIRCNKLTNEKSNELRKLNGFINSLSKEFEIGIVTLNYDNIFTQAQPDLETGFDKSSGEFNYQNILDHSNVWNFIYHLHGSIHFNMNNSGNKPLHSITWAKDNLGSTSHHYKSTGRNTEKSMEKIDYITSPIIAGYGKTNQLLRSPFLTYFSQTERLVHQADAFLFLGYGFNDLHLNATFASIREKIRPVVIVTFAGDKSCEKEDCPTCKTGKQEITERTDCLQQRHDSWSINLGNTIDYSKAYMIADGEGESGAHIGTLNCNNQFEVSSDPKNPLAVWYGGMLSAFDNAEKIIQKLKS